MLLLDLKFSILREVSACPRAPKVVLFRRANFLLEALFQYVIKVDYPFRNEAKSEWSRQQIENRGNNVSNGKRRWRQIFIVCFILYPLPNRELCELDKPFSSSWTYWEEILNMTIDWSNGKVKIQHYVKTNPMHTLKIIMMFKIYMNNDKYYYIF